jgi:hypothetical protein
MKNKHPNCLFCCFEGDDSKYYGIRIEFLSKYRLQELVFFNCGGKEEVVRLHALINKDQTFFNVKLAYFIDLDFDTSIKGKYNPPIYETPCYSVENFYTSIDCFSRILISEFGLNNEEPEYNACIKVFTERQTEFHDAVTLLNAWVACQREMFKDGKSQRADLANINLNELISINLDRVESQYKLEDIEKTYPAVPRIDNKIIDEKIEQLKLLGPQKYFRGKFEIEFLRRIIQLLKADATSATPKLFAGIKTKAQLNISRRNIISELSQYADTPECCEKYIGNFKK